VTDFLTRLVSRAAGLAPVAVPAPQPSAAIDDLAGPTEEKEPAPVESAAAPVPPAAAHQSAAPGTSIPAEPTAGAPAPPPRAERIIVEREREPARAAPPKEEPRHDVEAPMTHTVDTVVEPASAARPAPPSPGQSPGARRHEEPALPRAPLATPPRTGAQPTGAPPPQRSAVETRVVVERPTPTPERRTEPESQPPMPAPLVAASRKRRGEPHAPGPDPAKREPPEPPVPAAVSVEPRSPAVAPPPPTPPPRLEREPTIEVRIGRVEVRAPAPPAPPPVAAPAGPPVATRGLADLALARRHLDRTWY
jgi:hypothetical protein